MIIIFAVNVFICGSQKCPIHIRYSPSFTESEVCEEAVRLLSEEAERQAEMNHSLELQKQQEVPIEIDVHYMLYHFVKYILTKIFLI